MPTRKEKPPTPPKTDRAAPPPEAGSIMAKMVRLKPKQHEAMKLGKPKANAVDLSFKVSALDRAIVNADGLSLGLLAADGSYLKIDTDHNTAACIAHIIADALIELKKPEVDPKAGVALFEATRSEFHPETPHSRLGLPQKFVLTAYGQGSTKITLRLNPSEVDNLLAHAEQHSARKARAKRH